MRPLRRFIALPPARRGLVLRSAVLVVAVRLGLTALPFSRLQALLARFRSRPTAARSGGAASVDELAWTVSAVSKYVPRATCLTQALSLDLLLARHGHPATLRIGVAKEDGRLQAHAWVESGGRVLLGHSGSLGFTPLFSAGHES